VTPADSFESQRLPAPSGSAEPPLETGYVLFMDIVGYSRSATDDQKQVVAELNDIVRQTEPFRRADADGQLVSLPTGDGLALVFFGPNLLPAVNCAFEIARALKTTSIQLRMGLHSGPVYRLADINRNLNVAGGGINFAQRVMDCGDADHILASSAVAEVLGELSAWRSRVHPVGRVQVKHGVTLSLFNLYDDEIGNPAVPRKARRARMTLVRSVRPLVAASLAVVALVGVFYYARGRSSPPRSSSTDVRRAVALFGCKNLSGRPDAAWMSIALTQMLATELAVGREIRTVPGESVARAKVELGLADADTYSKETLEKIRKNLGADLVVVGSYVAMSGASNTLRVDLRIQDAATAETVAAVSETGTEQGIFEMISRLGSNLRRELGVAQLSAAERQQVRQALPATPSAARLYAEGLQRLRLFDAAAGRDLFARAITEDPSHALAHSALASAWSALGYQEKAAAAAKVGVGLAGTLPEEDRLQIEAGFLQLSRQWDRAATAYTRLVGLVPDDLDARLELNAVQRQGGNPAAALATLDRARALARPLGDDPRIDLAEAQTRGAIGEHGKRLDAAERVIRKGQQRGAALIVAEGMSQKASALFRLGRFDEAIAAANRARDMFAGAGDRGNAALAVTSIAGALYERRELDQAKALFEQALDVFRTIGRRDAVAGMLNNIANVLQDEGDLTGAKKLYGEALAITREVGPAPNVAIALNNLGNVSRKTADIADARRLHQEAADLFKRAGDLHNASIALASVALDWREQGELRKAREVSSECLALARRTGAAPVIIDALGNAAEMLHEQGDFDAARKLYDEAIELQKGTPRAANVPVFKGAAYLELDAGNLAKASALAAATGAAAPSRGSARAFASHHTLLASIALARNDTAGASAQIAEALRLSIEADRLTHFWTVIVAARVEAARDPAAARRRIEPVVAETRKSGLVALWLEALLASGEIEQRAGNTAGGRQQLAEVGRAASVRGFGRIAKAATKLQQPRRPSSAAA